MAPRAFTLIEVMAVVLLLGLLATGVMFSLANEAQNAHKSEVLSRLRHEDDLARLAARRAGNATVLHLDLQEQRLWRTDLVGNEERLSHAWILPAGYRIDRVLRPGRAGKAMAEPDVMQSDSGIVDLTFSGTGYAETYALHLIDETDHTQATALDQGDTWLVFAGLTGQRMVLENEDEVRKLFATLGTRGLTLVEVLAALVIMGTILSGMVMAKAHHTRQIALTQQRVTALHLADDLISGWWHSPQGVPINQHGGFESDAMWIWETRLLSNPALEALGTRVVRIEVRPIEVQGLRSQPEAAVAIELVLPDPEKRRRQEDDSNSKPAARKNTTNAQPLGAVH